MSQIQSKSLWEFRDSFHFVDLRRTDKPSQLMSQPDSEWKSQSPTDPLSSVLSFIEAINSHDNVRVGSHLSLHHKFIDAKGNAMVGKAQLTAGWAMFDSAYPNYHITVDNNNIFVKDNRVSLYGWAAGHWKEDPHHSWKVPASWLADVDSNGHIKEWAVYCDTAWANPPLQSKKGEIEQ